MVLLELLLLLGVGELVLVDIYPKAGTPKQMLRA